MDGSGLVEQVRGRTTWVVIEGRPAVESGLAAPEGRSKFLAGKASSLERVEEASSLNRL